MGSSSIPFVASFWLSFTHYDLLSPPEWTGLDNYEKLLTRDRTFTKSLSVTLLYVFLTVPLKLAFALGPAFAHLASAWLIAGFSLDEAGHADIRRQLDSRDAAAVPAE